MQQPQLKTIPRIKVDVYDIHIFVSGRTGPRAYALGFKGLGFKWDRDKQRWKGPLKLSNLRILDKWPEVERSPKAQEALETFEKAEEKRLMYQSQKVKA